MKNIKYLIARAFHYFIFTSPSSPSGKVQFSNARPLRVFRPRIDRFLLTVLFRPDVIPELVGKFWKFFILSSSRHVLPEVWKQLDGA